MGGFGGKYRLSLVARLLVLGGACLTLGNCVTAGDMANQGGASQTASRSSAYNRGVHNQIVCNERGCSDYVTTRRAQVQRLSEGQSEAAVIGTRPTGCPRSFCGCEASRYLFGHIRPELNLASNWMKKFPRTAAAPGMAAARHHHVMVLISHVGGNDWLVHDGNSGRGLTHEHVRSIAGYVVVNPQGGDGAVSSTGTD